MTGRLDLDAAEVAELLSVPKTWVLESARYVRFDRGDVEAWVASCKQPGRPVSLRREVRA